MTSPALPRKDIQVTEAMLYRLYKPTDDYVTDRRPTLRPTGMTLRWSQLEIGAPCPGKNAIRLSK
jgi:hypothetical protein